MRKPLVPPAFGPAAGGLRGEQDQARNKALMDRPRPAQESKPVSIRQAIAWAAQELRRAGVDVPRLEAETLLANLLGKERSALIAHGDEPLPEEAWTTYRRLVSRRVGGEPLPYILGHHWFYGLKLLVTPDVLIPRPETETLVDLALEVLQACTSPRPRVVDVGTGSGAIALAVAAHVPRAFVVGTDISARALRVARLNAQNLGLPVHWVVADLLSPLRGPFDLILANLPYVSYEEASLVDPSVRKYEPPEAVWAGQDGTELIARLLDQAPSRLAPGGVVLLEIGYRQADAVRQLATKAFPEAPVVVQRDLAGRERVVQIGPVPA